MSSDELNIDQITEDRRKSIEATIKPLAFEALKAVGEMLFPFVDHPWREVYFDFINQNKNATFYHATTHDGVHIIYCKEQNKGMWFLPERGRGPLQAKGLEILQQIVAKQH